MFIDVREAGLGMDFVIVVVFFCSLFFKDIYLGLFWQYLFLSFLTSSKAVKILLSYRSLSYHF